MSIKGNSQELYVGKNGIVLADFRLFTFNKKYKYEEIEKIEYCFRSATEGGYMDFYDSYEHFDRFSFSQSANESIQRAVDYISDKRPDLNIEKHEASADPFYTKKMFIVLLSVFCSWPIGLMLCWCTGKRTMREKILFTVAVIAIHICFYVFWTWYTQIQISSAMNEIEEYTNHILNLF